MPTLTQAVTKYQPAGKTNPGRPLKRLLETGTSHEVSVIENMTKTTTTMVVVMKMMMMMITMIL